MLINLWSVICKGNSNLAKYFIAALPMFDRMDFYESSINHSLCLNLWTLAIQQKAPAFSSFEYRNLFYPWVKTCLICQSVPSTFDRYSFSFSNWLLSKI